MPEYLVLLKLNPTKIMEAMNAIRKMDDKPVAGVDLRYQYEHFRRMGMSVSGSMPETALRQWNLFRRR